MSDVREATFRNKVIWFSFAFSLLVVWVHSYNAELYLGKTEEMAQICRMEHWIGDWISQIAVPGFFMISGYLFYRDFTWEKLRGKWDRRIRSVLVPYILWNFLYYLGYVIGSRLPWMRDVVGKGVIPFNLNAMVDAIINYTYNYVFWYLYQLILLILLAPVLYPVLRHVWSRIVFFVALAGMVLADVRLPLLNADALLYYSAAAASALSPGGRAVVEEAWNQQANTDHDHSGRFGALTGTTRAAIGAGLLLAAAVSYSVGISHALAAGFVVCRLFAMTGLWLLVPGDKLPTVRDFMRCNFFLYATHFALVRFINKAGVEILRVTPAVPLALFLMMPGLVLMISTLAGKLLRRLSPAVWKLLNGGR